MLTRSEVQLLKELKAAGEPGRRIAGTSSAEIAHLIGAQYIKRVTAEAELLGKSLDFGEFNR
jgi:hypothetical protein